MEPTTLTVDDLYGEIADLARDQGVSTQEVWNDLVDEVVDGHTDLGEIDAEEDTEGMKRDLRAMWGEYKIESSDVDEVVADVEDFDVEKKEEDTDQQDF